MRWFGTPSRLASMPTPLRVLLTYYILTVLLGLASAFAKYAHHPGVTPESIGRYYAGEDDPDALVTLEPAKGAEFLNDVTHPHLFSVPIVLLVLCHLVHLTGISTRFKVVLDAVVFLSFLATFGLPWILPAHPDSAIWLIVSGSLFFTATAILCFVALGSMWLASMMRLCIRSSRD